MRGFEIDENWVRAKLRVMLMKEAKDRGWTLPRGAEVIIVDVCARTLEEEKLTLARKPYQA